MKKITECKWVVRIEKCYEDDIGAHTYYWKVSHIDGDNGITQDGITIESKINYRSKIQVVKSFIKFAKVNSINNYMFKNN